MTIEEVKTQKMLAEDFIKKVLVKLQEDTGMKCTSIDFESIDEEGFGDGSVVLVRNSVNITLSVQ